MRLSLPSVGRWWPVLSLALHVAKPCAAAANRSAREAFMPGRSSASSAAYWSAP